MLDKPLQEPVRLVGVAFGMPLNADGKRAARVFARLDEAVRAGGGGPVRRGDLLDGLVMG